MAQQEYEQKRAECWDEFIRANPSHNKSIFARKVFGFAFDRAYALGKQEKEAEVYFATPNGGLCDISKIYVAIPANNETKEIAPEEIVVIQ